MATTTPLIIEDTPLQRRGLPPAVCFCGEIANYEIPGTRYTYCLTHGGDTISHYRVWFRLGGQSRYM